jgi:hypothetical protein
MSFSTLIFLAFAALTAFRFIGQMAGEPGATPRPTTRPNVESTAPGPITFGIKQNDNCEIEFPATRFATGSEVRWVAQLSEFQAPDAAVVVLYLRGGSRINREEVPPDPSLGKWDTLCSGDPVIESSDGHYIIEIWNEDLTMLLARGGYDVAATGP